MTCGIAGHPSEVLGDAPVFIPRKGYEAYRLVRNEPRFGILRRLDLFQRPLAQDSESAQA